MPFWANFPRPSSKGTAPSTDARGEEDAEVREALDRLLAPFTPWLPEEAPPSPTDQQPVQVRAALDGTGGARRRLVVRLTLPPTVIVAVTAVAAMVVFVTPGSALRPYVVIVFTLVCPGSALVRLLAIADPLLELATGIGLSIAIETLASTALLYAHVWSPDALFAGLVFLTLGAASAEMVRVENPPRSAL
jgi:hypothetical protein